MVEKKFVQIKIARERKQRWKDAIDESLDYRSMTHLIVTAVEAELSDDPDEGSGISQVDLTEMHDRFDSVDDQLNYIEDRVDDIFALHREEERDATLDLVTEVIDLMPEIPSDERDSLLSTDPERFDDPLVAVEKSGSIRHLVKHLITPPQERHEIEVEQAMEIAERRMTTVHIEDARPAQDSSDMRIFRTT